MLNTKGVNNVTHFGTITGNAAKIAFREKITMYVSGVFDWERDTTLSVLNSFHCYRNILLMPFESGNAWHVKSNPDMELEFCDDY
tara:strand:- start:1644 stop:1898 length:255 start_codon:yes stop_codon:yes gene_type:complete